MAETTKAPERAHFAVWPSYVPRSLDLPANSIWENLEISSRRHPEKPAFICYDSPITYGELRRDAERLAGFLQKRCGVAKGDRVILYAQNSINFVIAYYAILRADAVVVPLNPMNLTDELRRYAKDCAPKAAIAGAGAVAARSSPSQPTKTLRAGRGGGVQGITSAQGDRGLQRAPTPSSIERQPIAGENVTLWS